MNLLSAGRGAKTAGAKLMTPFLLSLGLALAGCTNTTVAGLEAENAGNAVPGQKDGDLTIVATLPPPENTRDGADQPIAPGDILEVDVFQVDQLDKTVQVDSNGRFSMPLVGAVEAAGKSVSALELELERKYGANYLQSPDITIFIKESAGQRMTLDGQFVKPGIYSTSSTTTLLQAVALGSGLTAISDEKKVYVFREFPNKKLVANYDLSAIRKGKQRDPRIYGGDVVVAFPSNTKIAARNLRQALGAAVNITRIAAPL